MIIRLATLADAKDLMPHLRPWDRREIELLTGKHISSALPEQVINAGECYAACTSRHVIALFGITPVDSITARIGLICSRHISRHSLFCIKLAKKILHNWLCQYRVLFNIIAVKNRAALRWLKLLGAKILPEKIRIKKTLFATFLITKETLCAQ